jgi:threonine/homoserine/homoserine lactone efflux protein
MGHDELIALAVFAGIGSFTPGPNNVVASATGAAYGLRATLPHIVGVQVGFLSMLAAATGGVAALVAAEPALGAALHWAGIAYMAWLAFSLARSHGLAGTGGGPFRLPLGVIQSAVFQYLNPKAWMLSLAIAGTWLAGPDPWHRALVAGCIFSITAASSLLLWAAAGAALRGYFGAEARGARAINIAMAFALAATTIWLAWRG